MFGKIKNRLKDVFKSSEDLVEENHDTIEEVESTEEIKEDNSSEVSKEEVKDEPVEKDEESHELELEKEPEKKGFLKKIFGKKDEEAEVEELEKVEDEMLKEVPETEKEAIKEHKELPKEEVEKNKELLEKQIESEEKLETQVVEDMKESKSEDQKVLVEEPQAEESKEEPEKSEEEIEKEVEEVKPLMDAMELDEEAPDEKKGFFAKTFSKIKAKTIDSDDFDKIWAELQIFLLEINIAFEIVEKIENRLKDELIGNSFSRFKISEKIREVLEEEVSNVLVTREASFIDRVKELKESGEPVKILVLGVNGTGKTTTIAKIVKFLQKNDLSVCVAAADTFRAAAVEQLEEHSKALNFKLIMHKGGSDPAAVAFDAISHAKAKGVDVVLVDTAGRMPNNSNLMMELQKVNRISKSDLVVFVGDSVSGNDLIEQIELFNKGVEIDGVILTKVDTDEKPGSIVTAAYSIEKPIYFLGMGQTYDDLIEFDGKHIAQKLFDVDSGDEE